MASGSEKSPLKESNEQVRKTVEEEIYWKHMKNVRFLVVLSGDFQQNLSIPKKFAENMRAIIFNPKIKLHGPSGISWDVALMTGADGLFLHEGWEEFAAAHSLQENDTLIFKYDRKASFHVKIFNGACEKEASYFVKKCGHVMHAVEHQKGRDSSEIVEEAEGDDEAVATPAKKARVEVLEVSTETSEERQEGHERTGTHMTLRKRKPIQPFQRAVNVKWKKMLRSSKKPPEPHPNVEPESSEEAEDAVKPNQNSPSRKDVPSEDQNSREANGNDPEFSMDKDLHLTTGRQRKNTASEKKSATSVECYSSNRRAVTKEEKNEAVRLALEKLTEGSFIAIMRNSSCYKGFSMSIPSKWGKDFLGPKSQEIILRMGEKTWSTRYCFSRGALGTGWKQFALENNLEESDACLFKLVSPDYADVMLDVTIYRVVEDVTPPTRQ